MFPLLGLGLVLAFSLGAQDQALREAARLDGEHKCDEAESYYSKALAMGSASQPLLNNAGNHYLLCGQPDTARQYFESLLKINPAHSNANLQMARLESDRKQWTKALQYLEQIKQSDPAVHILRGEAYYWAGQPAAALATLDGLEKQARSDPRILFTLGLTFARMGLYERAEAAFAAVLLKHPDNFDVAFNLGRTAARAQHYDQAQRALEVALKLQPDDADSLFELGLVHAAREDYSRAVYRLAQARQRAPKRADILLALARAAEDAGYYGDSALAYDEYLQLKAGDDTVRRDRARVYGYTGKRLEEGLKELAWYVEKHPNDPVGHYNLAQLSWASDSQKSLDQLSAALRLDPGYVPARYARAWLLHRLGRTAESVPDLLEILRTEPANLRALDQLGLAYLSLDKPSEAEKVLRRALAISAKDAQVLLHLSRALVALNREEEGQRYLEEFQQVRPHQIRDPLKEPGMIELATVSSAERIARQVERLKHDALAHPGDPELQLHLANLLLGTGRVEEAKIEFRELLTRNANSRIWEQAGAVLLQAQHHDLAREFLRRAAAGAPTPTSTKTAPLP